MCVKDYFCRCFTGGVRGSQSSHFKIATGKVLGALGDHVVKFEEVNIVYFRESNWSPADLVDWLLESHIHFITCHPHMHLDKIAPCIDELYSELERLKYHSGFPSNEDIFCPIWRQDKIEYLRALPPRYILPTCQVPMSNDMCMEATKGILDRYDHARTDTLLIKCKTHAVILLCFIYVL